ncbi:MAG: hypothetical protein ACRD12_20795 [Acidimicrobiales bacterium]
MADAAGVALEGSRHSRLSVAAATTEARFVVVALQAAGLSWEAEVGFCDPWPYAWGLLGHLSFFRFFVVTFRAADFEFVLEPNAA